MNIFLYLPSTSTNNKARNGGLYILNFFFENVKKNQRTFFREHPNLEE